MTAMWAAQWFSKKKPEPLEKLLSRKPEKKTMTDEEMFQQVKLLHEMFGGE